VQLVLSHWQRLLTHSCPLSWQSTQLAPAVPQLALPEVRHSPDKLSQQPFGHVLALQATQLLPLQMGVAGPEHPPHVSPAVPSPHLLGDCPEVARHVPSAPPSQQPPGQLVPSHVQVPARHS
jgi:hypothetical protein